MSVKVVDNDSSFQTELGSAGSKLVVVDFYAVWCGPCQRIAPIYEQLAAKYPKALFLKVDVDKCPESASSNGVTAMPTFILFRNKVKVDSLRGADPNALEEKIKKFYDAESEDESGVKGYMDLTSFIEKNGCECLNEADNHTLPQLLSKAGALESDCDEQLLIHIQFNQPVKLHSLKLSGPPDNGPKVIKLFINQPGSLDFDKADSMEPIQLLVLTADDIANGALIPLKFVKFQNVQNITLFVKENLSGSEKTQIDQLSFIGSPIGATNMSEFKRVAGKKGESH